MGAAEGVVADIPGQHGDSRPVAAHASGAPFTLQLLDRWRLLGIRLDRRRPARLGLGAELGSDLVDLVQHPFERDVDRTRVAAADPIAVARQLRADPYARRPPQRSNP